MSPKATALAIVQNPIALLVTILGLLSAIGFAVNVTPKALTEHVRAQAVRDSGQDLRIEHVNRDADGLVIKACTETRDGFLRGVLRCADHGIR